MSLLERWGLRHVESVDDYLSVLIPLDKAHLYSHSAKQGRAGSASRREDAEVGDADEEKDGENETSGMLHGHAGEYSIEGLRKEMRQGNQGKWTSNEIKSKLINKALQDIGMGTYNWQLFVLCGFGWFADNLWLQGASLTLPSLSAEFGVSEKTVRYTTSALFVGLALGSFSWGIGSDYVGRRVPFNVTLLIASVFGIATAYQQSWGAFAFSMLQWVSV
uniref:Major facilitator superfamily (MFS) profile domain-containing protein n=1 Tax=Bionectria ochroleuca TaxID=29856 RepID=A0A8H7NGA2_BIOOC